ncbi:apolipoprotein N-acyltransferase [Acidovorax carolinensis]|uniref:Apolipoprotein N-acyltransferase n=1 Tax=Acidovorax carolinensis TaxID=553814 RepID=A0A240UA06_9BURK|nr:apolipoprotein N-acyltransferase [Acidovorax carolinensis]ART56127.1 apolipoprotein N-acyltransferase [Acidovorax carolinensis]ART57946.1 apolipoprotein N-acyltransferase [Acidovorax carolinensis]
MARLQRLPGAALAMQACLAALAGGAQALSLAWPGNGAPQWWLQILSLAVLAGLVRSPTSWRRAAGLGWVFATAWLAATFWWLFISMHTYGGLAAPLAVVAVLGLAAFLGSYYAAGLAIFSRLAPTHRALTAMLFGAVWLLAELARGTLWTGFPWGAGGYAHVQGPLSVLARTVGVYGVGFVAAVLAMLLAQARTSDLLRLRAWALVAGGALVLVGAGLQRQCAVELCHTPAAAQPAPISLALLQGNIPQDEKFQPGSGVPLALQWYADALLAAKATLVVAPETAIPLLPQQLMPGYLEGLAAHFGQGTQAALLGIPLGDPERGYTNSVLGIQPAQPSPYQYDKHHLVPFGEFIPPFFRWFTAMMNIPLGDFNRGAVGQPSFAWAGQRIAPNICYEDLFGEELGARFADPASAPTVFVNFSNIGWFGNTVAIDQHLQISRMRALEFERPMVRATNTGATAIIDHRGVVTHALARHTRGVLTGEVHGRGLSAQQGWGITPYAWWVARWGLAPLWLVGVCMVVGAAFAQRRQR